ncbi:alkaline phosphatase [Imbroritus primus]|uniref:Alkaline phosphatase n=1 Tax=Imbroritus primus TaxID=3058603 RepID=A0ACD3SM10_9BURK|nr:alkaline phosphatase [Burkholderiaceae bacterium PBA]
MPDRRDFLKQLALGSSVALATVASHAAEPVTAAAFPSNPFRLGVASGYPTHEGVVLWTRLAPHPLEAQGGMPPVAMDVQWEIAEDEGFRHIVQRGVARARPEEAHAVHVELHGLEAEAWFFYRFRAGGYTSRIGRTRTAPAPEADAPRLRFTVASCQNYEHGYYGAYQHMLAEEPDLVLFLGDYIYETSTRPPRVREHAGPVPRTLAEYRQRHAQYKMDPDLQAMHAAAPWLLTWDDHEVENDYAGDASSHGTPVDTFLRQRAAAYRAYYEHMPLPRAMLFDATALRLYSTWHWGRLADFHLLDDRQYRSMQACGYLRTGAPAGASAGCLPREDDTRTMLSPAQEAWLDATLAATKARWNLLAQQTLFSPLGEEINHQMRYRLDGWDGYPAARQRLIDTLVARHPSNPVFLGGDVHSFMVSTVRNPADAERKPVATEFVTGSITSRGPGQARMDAAVRLHPHLLYANSRRHGYLRIDVTPQQMLVELRGVDSVERMLTDVSTLARFAVTDGKVGARNL